MRIDVDLLYFAYGSNLLSAQLTARVAPHRLGDEPPLIAFLPDFRFAFNMWAGDGCVYANVMPHRDGVVHGAVYRCGREALALLDVFEFGYERREMSVFTEFREELIAHVYLAVRQCAGPEGRPVEEYLNVILAGAREKGLPEGYILAVDAAARAGPAGPDSNR